MEDILSMILLMIIYIAAAAVNGKKEKKTTRQVRTRSFQNAFDGVSRASGEGRRRKAPRAAQGRQNAPDEACESKPIHLHDVPQSAMKNAAEGEDPCHAGGAKRGEPPEAAEEPETDSAMQDVLRGVIMSEILTRPCERRAMQRNRRGI